VRSSALLSNFRFGLPEALTGLLGEPKITQVLRCS
jgi:hypothetical protein